MSERRSLSNRHGTGNRSDMTKQTISGARQRSLITAAMLFAVVGGMVGLAYASVPLYRLFCQVTGFGGTPRIAAVGDEAVTASETPGRTLTVRFDSTVNSSLPWRFKPVQRALNVKAGEQKLAFYSAENLSDKDLTGTATFNVTPHKAAQYFVKIDCFCFTEQRLEAGQTVEMPVSFYVDPEILTDENTADVSTITLSYTFFREKNDKEGTVTRAEPNTGRPPNG